MPIYEYASQKCSHTFDALQKMSADPLTECPECGEHALKKLLSAPNFRLKGSGWYETDFKTNNQRNLVEGSDKKAAEKPAENGNKSGGAADKDGKAKGKDSKAEKGSGDKASGAGKPSAGKSGNI
jgi:putative FmdB family regulatory protein